MDMSANEKKIAFSVAMCVYSGDNAEFFDRALESITDLQTVKPSEVVLVVDGPVPEMIDDVIEKYEDMSYFRVIRFSENRGHGNARRASVSACTKEIVALMDADDVSVPDRFEMQLEYLLRSEVDVVGGDIAEFVGDVDNVVAFRRVPCDDKGIKQYMEKRCPFNQMSVMFRKSMYDKAGGYIDWYCDEDYYLWLRMFQCGARFANTGTVLVNVRTGVDMYARRGGKRYFESERLLQKYMLEHQMIGYGTYAYNVMVRWVVQCCLPNSVRGFVFRHLARSK